jgi:hypothetical protein
MPSRPDGAAGLLGRDAEHAPAAADEAGRSPAVLPWLVAVVSLVLAKTVITSRPLLSDSFYDLYAGRYIVQHGIPRQNVVTVAAHGAPWVDQQWLAHVLYYGAWAVGGYPLLTAMSAVLVTSGFALLAGVMLRRGVPPTRMVVWTLGAFAVSLGNIEVRAQSFGYPLLALTIWLVTGDDRGPRLRARTWLVIPVLAAWANTHGSVLLGVGIVVLYAGYQAVKALVRRAAALDITAYLALGIASAATVLCTPYGVRVFSYYRQLIGNPVLSHYVLEWAPPNLRYQDCWAFFALVLASAIAVVVAWRRGTRPDPLLLVLAVALLALAFTAIRNQAWFGFGGSLLAADTLARSSRGRVPDLSPTFRRLTAGALAALALASLVVLARTPDREFESLIPRKAIDAAAAQALRLPGTRVLGDDWSGSALLWLHPAMLGRVGFDVRFEQYPAPVLSAYTDFVLVRARSWQRVMRGYDLVVVSRREHPQLAAALARLPGWRVVYQDDTGLVIERVSP